MTSIQIFSLLLLGCVFILSFWRHINLGLAMLPGAFLLAHIAGLPAKTLYSGYPTQLTILVLGVMFLWHHVQESGLTSLIVRNAVKLATGRVYFLPWIMFSLTALISGIGALPAAAFAITIPVALEIAKREKISVALMGIICIQGGCVGGFSPFNPWGVLVATMARGADIAFLSTHFFVFNFILGLAVSLVAFFAFGGIHLLRRKESIQTIGVSALQDEMPTFSDRAYRFFAGLSVLVFIVMVVMKFDIGLTGFALGFLLMVAFPNRVKNAVMKLPWAILIMIAGVLLYVHLLEALGVMEEIGSFLSSASNPALVRIGLSFVGTIVANFESSSIAVLGLVIPIAIKALPHDLSAVSATWHLSVLAGSIVVMCSSPFHIGGALVLAEASSDEKVYKQLLIWVLCLAACLPFVALLAL